MRLRIDIAAAHLFESDGIVSTVLSTKLIHIRDVFTENIEASRTTDRTDRLVKLLDERRTIVLILWFRYERTKIQSGRGRAMPQL